MEERQGKSWTSKRPRDYNLNPSSDLGIDARVMRQNEMDHCVLPFFVRKKVGSLGLVSSSGCAAVLQMVVAARGAMNILMAEVIEDHIRMRVADPSRERNQKRGRGAEELIEVIQSYLK